jgi:protein involved in polysaccharide export with SLBB domain
MKKQLLMMLALSFAVVANRATAQTNSAESATIAPQTTAKHVFSTSSPESRANWQKNLTLGPGDRLNFVLYGQPDTAKTDLVIGPDGRVTFLQAEDIDATGLTIDELRKKFDDELGKFYGSPRTVITPSSYRSKKYYLLGAVTRKGVFQLERPTTMIEAIAHAGGLETGMFEQNTVELADLSHSFVIRDGKRLKIDFVKLFQQGDLSQNVPLEPNDYIYFPSSSANQIFVVGAVAGQGVVPYSQNATLISAITSRGGFMEKAYQSRVLVVRGSLDSPETFIVDAKAILAGEKPDFRLEPKDIVYVSRRPWARAEEILDGATLAFIQSALVTWTGQHVGPFIKNPID